VKHGNGDDHEISVADRDSPLLPVSPERCGTIEYIVADRDQLGTLTEFREALQLLSRLLLAKSSEDLVARDLGRREVSMRADIA
jgi:hypothetical protein